MEHNSQVYFVFYPLAFYKGDFLKCFNPVYTGAMEARSSRSRLSKGRVISVTWDLLKL